MNANDHKQPHFSESPDTEVFIQYRSVSAMAVVGLFFGLLSPLALIDPVAWLVPVAAIAICWIAIIKIRSRDSVMIGRKAAICGLVIAVLSGTAAVSSWFARKAFIERQARTFATAWFSLLSGDQPLKAHQLTLLPPERKPFDAKLAGVYEKGPKAKEELDEFLGNPLVFAALNLGDKADIRFRKCEGIQGPSGKENIKEVFSISFDDESGKRQTFAASLLLRRLPPIMPDQINWVIADIDSELKSEDIPKQ